MKLDSAMKVFRATDAFAVEAYRVARGFPKRGGEHLGGEILRTAIRSGGAVVAASASAAEGASKRAHLRSARIALVEGRYYLYLARRFGLLDFKKYRSLTVRQDAALREVENLLRDGSVPRPPR